MDTTDTEGDKKYTTGQAGEMLGVSASTVKRLCNLGLIPGVRRDRRLGRLLEEWQVNYVGTLLGLRKAGFSNAELRRYSRLFRQNGTALERKALLETRKRQIWQELEDCRENIDFLERQVELLEQE